MRFYPGEGPSRGLLRDYENFVELRLQLYYRLTAAVGSSWTLRRAAGPGWTAACSSWTGVWKASAPLQQLLARTTSSSTPQVSTQPLAVLAVLTWGYILRKYFHCNIFLHFTFNVIDVWGHIKALPK